MDCGLDDKLEGLTLKTKNIRLFCVGNSILVGDLN
jgi:hypothetical protein